MAQGIKVLDIFGALGLDTAGFKRKFNALPGLIKGPLGLVTKVVAKAAKVVAVGLTAAAATLTGVIVKSVMEFAKLEKGVAEIITLFGKAGDEAKPLAEELTKIVQTLVADFGQGVPEAIKATYDAVSAGIQENDIGQFMQDAAKLAIAGVTDISTSVDLLTSIMNAYGIGAEDAEGVSDKLFETVKQGKTTIEELASRIGRVAPTAAAAGVKLGEMLSALAAMTKQGIKTAEASTSLAAILSNILKPTEGATKKAEELGIEFNATALKAKGLAQFLEDVRVAAGGDAEVMTELFGSIEAVKGAFALTSDVGTQDFMATLEAMGESAGNTETAFDTMAATISFQWQKLKGNLTVVWQEIGKIFGGFVEEKLTEFNKWFKDNRQAISDWTDEAKRSFEAWATAVETYLRDRGLRGVLADLRAWFDDFAAKLPVWLAEFTNGLARWWNENIEPIAEKASNLGIAIGKNIWQGFKTYVAGVDWGGVVFDSILASIRSTGALGGLFPNIGGGGGEAPGPSSSDAFRAQQDALHGPVGLAGGNTTIGPNTFNIPPTDSPALTGQAVADALLDFQRFGGISKGATAVQP